MGQHLAIMVYVRCIHLQFIVRLCTTQSHWIPIAASFRHLFCVLVHLWNKIQTFEEYGNRKNGCTVRLGDDLFSMWLIWWPLWLFRFIQLQFMYSLHSLFSIQFICVCAWWTCPDMRITGSLPNIWFCWWPNRHSFNHNTNGNLIGSLLRDNVSIESNHIK